MTISDAAHTPGRPDTRDHQRPVHAAAALSILRRDARTRAVERARLIRRAELARTERYLAARTPR